MKNLSICILLVVVFGCSSIKVARFTGKETGQRYSLGKPFIQVVPDPSGSGAYTVSLVYLPDQSQTYAVTSETFMAKSIMELELDGSGILKKVSWNKENDGISTQVTSTAGDIAKAALEEKTKGAEDAKKNLKEAQAEKEKADDALAQKSIELEAAQNELTSLKTLSQTTEVKERVRAQELAVKKLEAELKLLEKKASAALKIFEASAYNDPTADNTRPAWGPVFFAIEDKCNPITGEGTVELKAVNWTSSDKQMKFNVHGGEYPVVETVPSSIRPVGDKSYKVKFASGKAAISKIEFDVEEIVSIPKSQTQIQVDGKIGTKPSPEVEDSITFTIQTDKKSVKVDFPKEIKVGKYNMQFDMKFKDKTTKKEVNSQAFVKIEVE